VTHPLTPVLEALLADLAPLSFVSPVSHVYNPLVYARGPHDAYLSRYGTPPREILLLGMNPGPWGMAQTGVPFGEVSYVRDWMGITAPVSPPDNEHPKRPILGLDCPRSEVSGRRLWGWAKERWKTPEAFFARFFVLNYCPLVFMEAGGKNRTPNQLPAAERTPLMAACDRALRRSVEIMAPRYVIGVGAFAESRARQALNGMDVRIDRIIHPSPANPKANRGWAPVVESQLADMGIAL
jgi:single-strand selective monofunctional uracil DNA glycosylase